MKSRVGYHYTSYKNWVAIEEEGLHPYCMPEIICPGFKKVVYGVWLWKNKLEGLSHAGTVILQVGKKHTSKIVLLEVQYNEKDIYTPAKGQKLELKHDGHLNDFCYHEDEPSIVLKGPIEPKYIRLVKIYDIVELLK